MPRNPEGRGVLYVNKPEEGKALHPNAPGYKGRITIGGKEYTLSAWVETAGADAQNPGMKYFSIKADPVGYQQRLPTPDGEEPF